MPRRDQQRQRWAYMRRTLFRASGGPSGASRFTGIPSRAPSWQPEGSDLSLSLPTQGLSKAALRGDLATIRALPAYQPAFPCFVDDWRHSLLSGVGYLGTRTMRCTGFSGEPHGGEA
jgi:hypothetical protein